MPTLHFYFTDENEPMSQYPETAEPAKKSNQADTTSTPTPADKDGLLDSLGKAISSPVSGAAEPDEESRDKEGKPSGA